MQRGGRGQGQECELGRPNAVGYPCYLVMVGAAAVVVDDEGASLVGGVRVVVVRGASVVDVWGTVVEVVGVVELFDAFTSATTAITATIAIATARAIMSPFELPCWGAGVVGVAGATGSVAGGSGIADGGYHLPSVACHQPSPPDWSDTSISSE